MIQFFGEYGYSDVLKIQLENPSFKVEKAWSIFDLESKSNLIKKGYVTDYLNLNSDSSNYSLLIYKMEKKKF